MVDANGQPVLNESGNKQYNFSNPVARDMNPVAIPNMDVHRSTMLRFIGSAFAEVKLFDGLKFKTQFSPDITMSIAIGILNMVMDLLTMDAWTSIILLM